MALDVSDRPATKRALMGANTKRRMVEFGNCDVLGAWLRKCNDKGARRNARAFRRPLSIATLVASASFSLPLSSPNATSHASPCRFCRRQRRLATTSATCYVTRCRACMTVATLCEYACPSPPWTCELGQLMETLEKQGVANLKHELEELQGRWRSRIRMPTSMPPPARSTFSCSAWPSTGGCIFDRSASHVERLRDFDRGPSQPRLSRLTP